MEIWLAAEVFEAVPERSDKVFWGISGDLREAQANRDKYLPTLAHLAFWGKSKSITERNARSSDELFRELPMHREALGRDINEHRVGR